MKTCFIVRKYNKHEMKIKSNLHSCVFFLHHMFSIGLDVDTFLVSLNMVTYLIIIWLFAENFLKRVSTTMFSIVGKIFNSNLINNNLSVIFRLNEKKSADNPLV
jgi:hypothetical protein